MSDINSLAIQMGFGRGHGYCETYIPGVKLFGANRHEASCPQTYNPGFVFILKGRKKGRACGKEFETSSKQFLFLANTYPIECETIATGNSPMLGLYIDLDKQELNRQLELLEQYEGANKKTKLAETSIVHSTVLTKGVRGQLDRLVEVLHSEVSAKILGPEILKSILFEILHSDARHILTALSGRDNKLARVSKAMSYIEKNLAESISVESLADLAGMSSSVFHRSFKETTGESPLQYVKKMRLNQARHLMVYRNQSALQASLSVGYESPNQFSREFKRYFGVTPSQAKKLPYSELTGL